MNEARQARELPTYQQHRTAEEEPAKEDEIGNEGAEIELALATNEDPGLEVGAAVGRVVST